MSEFLTKPDDNEKGYPKGVPYIVGNEGCERFSYYGMKAILYVFLWKTYMAQGLFADKAAAQNEATAIVHLFNTGVYALPMIGAIIADRFLGKYNIIMWLSVVYCIGHAFLAIFEQNMAGFHIGLALIAIGAGGIKPCVSAHVGDQFGKGNSHLLSKVFRLFYFIINFGSFFAAALIPVVYNKLGPAWAFGIPGILMGIATVAFWMGRKTFVHIPAQPAGNLGFLDSISGILLFMTVGHFFFSASWSGWTQFFISIGFLIAGMLAFNFRQKKQEDQGFLATTVEAIKEFLFQDKKFEKDEKLSAEKNNWLYGPIARKYGDERAQGPLAVWSIISVFLMVSVFWALFDQHSSTWIRQAESMNLAAPSWMLWIPGIEENFYPSQIPACNPILVMLLIPFCTLFLYPFLDKYIIKLNPLRTMTIGMLMAGFSFVAVYFIQVAIEKAGAGAIHVGWQLIPYTLITLAEVMVSITGLEFAYTQAPKSMKSIIMGFWLLTVSLGNVFVALLAKFGQLELSQFFLVFAGFMFLAGIIFGIRAKFYTVKTFES
jgi:POT family proton-dependent oligopeptide transporter